MLGAVGLIMALGVKLGSVHRDELVGTLLSYSSLLMMEASQRVQPLPEGEVLPLVGSHSRVLKKNFSLERRRVAVDANPIAP